ncbi:MAG TPA: response regulator transcription factor, partial [Isosphaeraceae bacterium]
MTTDVQGRTPGVAAGAEGPGPTRVLIVDDFLIERRVAGRIVEQIDGLEVIYAGDGHEALVALAHELPSVVLTDLQMPGMDGLELVEAVRQKYPHIPVILMTAHGSEEIAIRALRAGAASYVPKRSLARELPGTLHQVLAVLTTDQRRRRLIGCLEAWEVHVRLENDPELLDPLVELLQEKLTGMPFGDATTCMRVGIALQ